MSTTTQRPTPETDAVLHRIVGGLPAWATELRDKAFSLERERDEAREQIAQSQMLYNRAIETMENLQPFLKP